MPSEWVDICFAVVVVVVVDDDADDDAADDDVDNADDDVDDADDDVACFGVWGSSGHVTFSWATGNVGAGSRPSWVFGIPMCSWFSSCCTLLFFVGTGRGPSLGLFTFRALGINMF